MNIENIDSQLQLYNRFLLQRYDENTTFKILTEDERLSFEDIRISVIDFSGNVLYDNILEPTILDNHKTRPEIVGAIKKGKAYSIERISDSNGEKYFYSATKGEKIIIRTAIPYSDTLQELLEADMAFLWVVFATTLLMSILGFYVTNRMGKTITRLTRFARRAERGEIINSVEEFPKDELGEIAKHIVNLYTNLQKTIIERDKEHQLALSQEQDKIRIKRQLTNNINHELKTPIASIQVCLETLQSNIKLSDEKRNELIERGYTNCERLRNLLDEVSLITRLEEGSLLIQKERLSLNDIVDDIVKGFEIKLEEKSIKANIQMEREVTIEGNQSLIISVFQNLMENAIAYSEAKNIYFRLTEVKDETYHFVFEDDGVGVEDKHIPYLFERFYRVDKGRSRKMGGTGLGLAIVKHAVQFHNGTIEASKSEKGGLKLCFTLKRK